MSDSLQTGKFYGATRRRFATGGIVLSEIAHATGRKLPCHTHESAYFGLLLAGSYSEKCTGRSAEYAPFSMGFHPPALTHSDEVGRCGSRMFCVELRDQYLARTRPFLNAPKFTPDLCASEVTWLGLRLYRSFAGETLDALELEELCTDMLERVSGSRIGEERSRPAWLARAFELLQESYRQSLTLEEIAAQVGVHPIHLSRVFRKHYGCTMAEFLNRLRVQFACRTLAEGWADLADVASNAGFADQSHLGRVFKACTGQTPGKFRSFFHSQNTTV
jgi:AraC family transcriptional regulator